ncbi:TetR/AcrR family transcriptional regulator [Streptomyces scabiei]|uniref:TetR/AcrR family transcriptional regulator n=1 Tax=Streptomyces scabiei TaxID=1930 RepID=UPI0029B7C9EF|nr:TetR/AcrR family transcriptional regulator C-terminal domain-containing protein [Streptomyces scabiei]MDX3522431.1 TetR/AcrR family transcriptional regulator C-terminal domain-containing protein [Streptomyces scabiei]
MVKGAGRPEGAARASVWLEGTARARRGGQPSGLDRERITAASVRLLDAEGLGGFSMRRLAAELNVTAMSVYWYVDTKDELLELALDQAFAEMRLPPEDSGEDWRSQLRTLAGEYRAVLVRHPWVSPLAGTFLNIGPRSLDFSLAVQRVIGLTGLPPRGQAGAIAAVFQFVYGFGTIEGHFVQRCAAAGVTQEEYFRQAMSAVSDSLSPHEVIRHSADLMEARGGDTVEEMRERDFVYALETLVAGIEVMATRG